MLPAIEQDNKEKQVQKPDLHADHTWYNSLFTQLVAPLVAVRYVFPALEDLNPGNFLKKGVKNWKSPSWGEYASQNFTSLSMGTMFAAIIAVYSKNTLNDIKSVYAEAVGYELGKKPEDVNYQDIFFKSQNAALEVTRNAYTSRTLMRLATAAMFFIPWHKMRGLKELAPKYDVNTNMGVGALGLHLMGEGYWREPSFFDVEQKIGSSKINHKDAYSQNTIQPQDIQSLLNLQRRHLDPHYKLHTGASEEGVNDVRLSERIAALLNQTYHNAPQTEPAHFTIGKFNYLIGFGLLEKFPESMAFVELANKSGDMAEVKQAAAAIKAGQNPDEVFKSLGVDINQRASKALSAPESAPGETKFADKEKPAIKPQPKKLQDYAAQTTDTQLAL